MYCWKMRTQQLISACTAYIRAYPYNIRIRTEQPTGRGQGSIPHPGCSINFIHGRSDTLVWLNVSHQSLNDHESKSAHALGKLVLHLIGNFLLRLQASSMCTNISLRQLHKALLGYETVQPVLGQGWAKCCKQQKQA